MVVINGLILELVINMYIIVFSLIVMFFCCNIIFIYRCILFFKKNYVNEVFRYF